MRPSCGSVAEPSRCIFVSLSGEVPTKIGNTMYKQMYAIYGTEVVMHQYKLGLTHDLSRTLQSLDLRGYHFISQGALSHP